ncbi:MAG: leucine-rich repeat domain-containing protein [Coleofasciculus sp. G3-WIS-01]|uniref:leucine-rich repeat domain-containing protein n=1 Tax=Coleofasciculus sp. G3-WIS-01 TaxID=3069528 RepID=UPI0033026A76
MTNQEEYEQENVSTDTQGGLTRAELLKIITQAIHQGITELNLSNKRITKIPDEIAYLTNLRSLGLANNQLTEIPGWIAQLTHLRFLYLTKNQLTEIPEGIAQLTNLKWLDL